MTSGGGALHSDHVNYLILRYLQEAGHEKAATAFYTDWHREEKYRDPEKYAFAPVVRRGELVHVIQDGLYHDELLARVKKNDRKFRFTNDNTREAFERRERDAVGGPVENGTGGSRPSSRSAKRKGRPPAMRPPDDFPTPAPKRQRRSEGSEGVHLNGDAMDVDAASSGDAEEDGEAASPAVGSDSELPAERFDSMEVVMLDVAVQTNLKTGPKTSTMYWKVDRPGVTIYHSMFSPDPGPENARTLLAVGENLCRFYTVPESPEDANQVKSIDDPSLPSYSTVTASAWHPQGRIAACATDSIRELSNGRQRTAQLILCHSRDSGTTSGFLHPPLLEPAGMILRMRYSPNGEHLLVVRTNLKRGLALVYETSPDAESQEPVGWRITEHQMLDAVWTGAQSFVLCGEHGLVEAYGLATGSSVLLNGVTEETIPTVGLSKLPLDVPEPQRTWDKASFHDMLTGIYALASTEGRRLTVASRLDHSSSSNRRSVDLPGQLTAFAFQPRSTLPALLLTAFEDGNCRLFGYQSMDGGHLSSVVDFHLEEGPALTVAWSYDGQYLAVGGHDLIQIWDVDSLVAQEERPGMNNGNGNSSHLDERRHSLVTWRPDAASTKPRNGEHEEDRPLSEPSLSWSADGERLAFALDKQIAVMTFRPPLTGKHGAPVVENGLAGVNGHAHPT
ncbi:hypothetical protein LTR09_002387 [Extremus antarcticus]|uniref:LisH domain-containing protein n=1 Tax=Extremus antarcticus TaxID=702011 RepID=A0AAJ0GFM3_9PEZI|nr:hypothetical protein LTR09_002387 [Extremus antarcticus]